MAAAHDATLDRWCAHPWRARGVRVLVYALPVALSLGFVHLVTSITGAPTGSLWGFIGWWLAVSLGATAVVSLVYALTRRLLPLGALLELSLVFPDAAPSRFRIALGTGTVSSLEERVRLMRAAKEAPTTQEAAEILLELVAALSHHDRITSGHAERVRGYSYALGQRLGLAREELDRLNWAALLHDIGKLEVSQEILNKPGRPTEEDWESLRQHPLYGETLIAPLREWLGEWADAVGQHHERWDGKGYPRALAGEKISRAGRIVAIADVFDVITSSRSYKEPSSAAKARAELVRQAGTQFDPRFVRAFVDLSLNRMRLIMGPLSWLSHAPLLARIPPTPSVGAALGGAAAVATTAATLAIPMDAQQAAAAPVSRPAPTTSQPASAIEDGTPAHVRRAGRRGDVPVRIQRDTSSPRGDSPATPTSPPRSPNPDPTEPQRDPSPGQEPESPREPSPSPPPPQPPPSPTPSPPPTPTPTPPPKPAPNSPPTFAAGGNHSALEDSGPQSVAWATAISPGSPTETSQNVTFKTSNDNGSLFSTPPSIGPDGTLTYTPAPDAYGVAAVSVTAHDDGGTADGGSDTSATVTLMITVEPVNDAPSCSIGGNQTALSVLGKQTVSGFASSTPGPGNESGQSVSYVIATDKPEMFVVPPAISPDGTLTYTPRLLAVGVATVTVRAIDGGGTANGGTDTSSPRTFTITIV